MCGITGKFYFNNKQLVSREEMLNMTNAILHRGPDAEGVFVEKNIGLGHRRLSIIDLSADGNQPMSDNKQKIWIVFNGEIYNFLELRKDIEKEGIKLNSKTDTEVIIYLYKKYGVDCLRYLRGMFAFAIWDSEKQQLFLARDRVGKKPLKYYIDDKVFIFASELKAILKNPDVKKEPDFEAIDEYMTYQYVPHPKTGFKDIWKLPPAHYMIVKSNGEIELKRYWQISYSQKLDLSEKEWEEIVVEKLKESIRLRLISDVPLGAHLSGGIDSSLIVALMSQESGKQIKTFSIGFEESEYNELAYARKVAERYHTDHTEFIVKPNAIEILPRMVYHYEEPFSDSSALPTWYLSQMTKKHVTVALNGDGGDENFAGYKRYNSVKLYRQLKFIPFKLQLKNLNQLLFRHTNRKIFRKGFTFLSAYSNGSFDFYLNFVGLFSPKDKEMIYSHELSQSINKSRWRSFLEEIYNENEKFHWLDQLLYTDINSYLPEDLLVKIDIASMAHGLEIRSPFLDQELLELTAKIPTGLKIHGYNKKYILKQIAYKYIQKECIDRTKQGFGVPLEYWFRNELENYVKDNLLDRRFLDYGFKKEGIEEIILKHQSKQQDCAYQLWALLTLKVWFDTYFK